MRKIVFTVEANQIANDVKASFLSRKEKEKSKKIITDKIIS